MADTKQSPPRQVVKDFVRKPPSEAPGPAHACDAPGLAAKEFLYAIYRDPRLPMSTRIQAAKELLPFTESIPKPVVQGPTITIVIGGLKDPEQINEKSQLKEFLRAGLAPLLFANFAPTIIWHNLSNPINYWVWNGS